MDKTREIKINGLSNYLSQINENDLRGFISRGEDKHFDGIVGGIFRGDYSSLNGRKHFYRVTNGAFMVGYSSLQNDLVRKYYDEVSSTLTEAHRTHFLAFSHCHGLPTNLIEFTRSPVMSLYFACQESDSSKGYIYFIDDKKLININGFIETNRDSNYLEALLSFKEDTRDMTATFFDYHLNRIVSPSRLMSRVMSLFAALRYAEDFKQKYGGLDMEKMSPAEFIENYYKFASEDYHYMLINDKQIAFARSMVEERKWTALGMYLLALIKMVIFEERAKNLILPFYCVYCPPNIEVMVTNQSPVYVYQLFSDFTRQKIKPDVTFIIENKRRILDELDSIGINEKFIYSDYDNVAKYIKRTTFN